MTYRRNSALNAVNEVINEVQEIALKKAYFPPELKNVFSITIKNGNVVITKPSRSRQRNVHARTIRTSSRRRQK